MEKPQFIKCEPKWQSDIEDSSNFGSSMQLTHDHLMEVKVEQDFVFHDPIEEKEHDSQHMKNEAGSEECDIRRGASQDDWSTELSITNCDKNQQRESGDQEEKGDSYPCATCGKLLTLRVTRNNNFLVQSGEEQFSCSSCASKFSRSEHLQQRRTPPGEEPHLCTLCGRTFTRKSYLKTLHLGQSDNCCSICGKLFILKSQLSRHRSVHSSDRPHCCLCGKSFTRTDHLKTHLLVHLTERPHSCSTCGKSFTQVANLRRHQVVHVERDPQIGAM